MSDTVELEEMQELVKKGSGYILIDVRRDDEMQYGMIPTAKRIPMELLEEALDLSEEDFKEGFGFDKIKPDDRVIFYCHAGGRSKVATDVAKSKGLIKAQNFAGSIMAWSKIDPHVKAY